MFVLSQSTQCEAALKCCTFLRPDGVQMMTMPCKQSLCSVSFTVLAMLLGILCNTRSIYEMSKANQLTVLHEAYSCN